MKTLTPSKKLKQLKEIIRTIWPLLAIYDDKEISRQTGLSLSTIKRLGDPDRITTAIHVGTLQSLASAAGLQIKVEGNQVEYAFVKEV